jgi:hypothetical protein
MRKIITLAAFVLLVAQGTAFAGPTAFGYGVFGGTSIPIKQDDNDGNGTVFGARFPVHFGWFLSLEPHFDATSGGSFDQTFGPLTATREGIDIKQPGINVILGNPTSAGFRLYPYGGIGHYSMSGEGRQEIEKVGYNGGIGIGFGGAAWKFDLRGDFTMIDLGVSSRKAASATAGLGYTFHPGY